MKEHFLQMKFQCSLVIDYNYGFVWRVVFFVFFNSAINSIQLDGHWLFVTVVHIKFTVTSSYMNPSCLAVPWRMSMEIQHVWATAGSCSASPATSYLLIFPSFTSSRSVSLLHRNTIWVILQDTRQVVIVSLEVSLSLPKLFFPLWDTQLKDYIEKVRCNSLNNLIIGDINHSKDIFTCLIKRRMEHWPLSLALLFASRKFLVSWGTARSSLHPWNQLEHFATVSGMLCFK